MRVIARLDNAAARLNKFNNNTSSSFKNGGKRSFSTSGTNSKPVGPAEFFGKTPFGFGGPYGEKTFSDAFKDRFNLGSSPKPEKEEKLDFSKKVMDRFFRTIAKEGTLVSLDKMEKTIRIRKGATNSSQTEVVYRKSKYPLLSNLFDKVGFRIFGAVFTGKGKFTSRLRQLNFFLMHLLNMRRHHGSAYVVKYLKTSQLALQKAIAGTKVSSLNQLDSSIPFPYLATCGLPRIIPIRDRRLILSGAPSVIRWWLTLFSVYRVIYIPGKLKLETITAPITVPMESVFEVAEELVKLVNPSMFDTSSLRDSVRFLFLESAGAATRVSWMGLLSDLIGFADEPKVFSALLDFLEISGNHRTSRVVRYFSEQLDLLPNQMGITSNLFKALSSLELGKLSTKNEAAGKVRVFAMVDVWTQSTLKPLHDMLFSFLRSLPNDGTFDQNASVKRCMVKSNIAGKSFGYDLSAATDRLPIDLQVQIINKLIPGLGDKWKTLLIERDYVLNSKEYNINERLRYSVGQPMGALSSWGMLAVTHHYIAQLAAVTAANSAGALSGPFWIHSASELKTFNLASAWYSGYEVLGDDIVFFEENVALEYLKIMDKLGVPINLAKSVVATNPTFEFAKVTGHRGHHVAAVSWAMFMAQPTVMGRAGIAYSLITKGIARDHVVRWLKSFARMSKFSEGAPNTFYLALGTMFSRKGFMPFYEFLYSIMQKTAGSFNVYKTLLEKANISTIVKAISQICKTWEPVTVENPLIRKRGWKTDEFELKLNLIDVINAFRSGGSVNGKTIESVNPHRDAIKLAYTILTAPMMLLSFGPRLEKCLVKGVFTLKRNVLANLDPFESFIHHVFCYLFVQIYEKLILIHADIENLEDDLHGQSLDYLMDKVDQIERYKEVIDLYARAIKKYSKEGNIPERNLMESPLAALQMIVGSDSLFGAEVEIYSAGTDWGPFALEYLYALERLDNLPLLQSNKLLGDKSPSSSYLDLFGPSKNRLLNLDEGVAPL
nr:putative RNA-dependent RNA polymerase [Rhizoctonia solani mitovirus 123]